MITDTYIPGTSQKDRKETHHHSYRMLEGRFTIYKVVPLCHRCIAFGNPKDLRGTSSYFVHISNSIRVKVFQQFWTSQNHIIIIWLVVWKCLVAIWILKFQLAGEWNIIPADAFILFHIQSRGSTTNHQPVMFTTSSIRSRYTEPSRSEEDLSPSKGGPVADAEVGFGGSSEGSRKMIEDGGGLAESHSSRRLW